MPTTQTASRELMNGHVSEAQFLQVNLDWKGLIRSNGVSKVHRLRH